MNQAKHQSIRAGIDHLTSHLDGSYKRGEIAQSLALIDAGAGSPSECAAHLGRLALARALCAWFRDGELEVCKEGMYQSAQLLRIASILAPSRGSNEAMFVAPLLSDHQSLIRWYGDAEEVRPSLDIQNPKAPGFRRMQMVYALRGEWPSLETRALKVLELAPASQKKFMVDYRFYLALARGDVAAMEAALAELTTDKMARVRNDDFSFSYTHFFIGTHAVIYAKLAWFHGFKVRVDSPYVPAEWLPFSPLKQYSDLYAFMAKFPLQ